MRELDVLLGDWLERHYATACQAEKDAFRELLELPDTELAGYLLRGTPVPDPVTRRVVAAIRGDH